MVRQKNTNAAKRSRAGFKCVGGWVIKPSTIHSAFPLPSLHPPHTLLTMETPKLSLLYVGQPQPEALAASIIVSDSTSHSTSPRRTHRPSSGRVVVVLFDIHRSSGHQSQPTAAAADSSSRKQQQWAVAAAFLWTELRTQMCRLGTINIAEDALSAVRNG